MSFCKKVLPALHWESLLLMTRLAQQVVAGSAAGKRIYHGNIDPPKSEMFPHHVNIMYMPKLDDRTILCGGSLLTLQ